MILVSKCLIGENCKYNGRNNRNDDVIKFLKGKEYIGICPETDGGLSVPRAASEIVLKNDIRRVINKDGEDVTCEFERGAEIALELANEHNPELIILKAKSPSCGKGRIYDGTFSGKLTEGNGITAELLIKYGYKVATEEEIKAL